MAGTGCRTKGLTGFSAGEYGGVWRPVSSGCEPSCGHRMMQSRRASRPMRRLGSMSKMRWRIQFSPWEMGRMDWRKLESRRKARKVASSAEARFHGLRPQIRLTRMTPRDQTSLGADS